MTIWRAIDVEAELMRDLTDGEAQRLPTLAAKVEREAIAYTKRAIAAETVVGEVHHVLHGERLVSLRRTPVVSIERVQFLSSSLAGSTVAELGATAYDVKTFGIEFFDACNGGASVTFDYTAGGDPEAIEVVRGVIASRLARMLRIRAAGLGEEVQQASIEGDTTALAGGVKGTAGWNDHEVSLLRPLRRKNRVW